MPEVKRREITFAQAVREGIDQAMTRDPSVVVIGQGVSDSKAIFNTTAQLRDMHGARRVFDMPLSENGMTGVCIGAALSGLRPVMVHQRIDFVLLAMDQLVNNAAKWYYMFDGKASVPMVVRLIVGRGWGQGPQHSQSLQAMFAHIPGLKVVMPTMAHDAKGMLIAAIEDNNPVVFIEHRWLYHISDVVPEEYYRVPLGRAHLRHQGDAVTVAAFSYMTIEALIAAKALLATMGVAVDVLDMRTVRPLDVDSVLTSVRKTGRLLVADTGFRTGSVAGELISHVAEQAFDALRTRPLRIASPDHPVPSSPFMAEGYYPGAQAIAERVLDLVGAKKEGSGYRALCEQVAPKGAHDKPNLAFTGPF